MISLILELSACVVHSPTSRSEEGEGGREKGREGGEGEREGERGLR